MTSAQKATLKTAIQADPTANTFYVNGDLTGLAAYLNALATPVFRVWKVLPDVPGRVTLRLGGKNPRA
jgi:hypothetical protein